MSAIVALQALWMNDGLVPSDCVAVYATAMPHTSTMAGSVRTYAGGRQRAITTEGVGREIDLTLTLLTPTQLAWVVSHTNRAVWLRDFTGTRRSVIWFANTATPYSYAARTDLTLKCFELTFSDTV